MIYIAISLNGYIADKKDNIDCLIHIENPKNLDFDFANYLNKIDVMVMGITTFETIMVFQFVFLF